MHELKYGIYFSNSLMFRNLQRRRQDFPLYFLTIVYILTTYNLCSRLKILFIKFNLD